MTQEIMGLPITDALDHGIIHVPVNKRGGGSLNSQIDNWKREHRRASRAADKARSHAAREKKLRIRRMLAEISDERVMALAAPLGCRKPSTARSALYRAAIVNLDSWIKALSQELPFPPGGCAACRAPFGECNHTPAEWMGPSEIIDQASAA